MTKAMRDAILSAIPVGSDRAISRSEIWKLAGQVGAESSFGTYLFELTASGAVKRRRHPIPTGFMWLYWREA